jgi:hypothetical protein
VPAELMDVIIAGLAAEPSERPTAAQLRDRLAKVDLGPEATVDRRALALTGVGTGGVGTVVVVPSSAESSVLAGVGGTDDQPSGGRGPRRRSQALFLGSLALLVTVLATAIVYTGLTNPGPGTGLATGGRPDGSTSGVSSPAASTPSAPSTTSTSSAPTAASTPSDASAEPSPERVQGFLACGRLGAGALCPAEHECWGGVQTLTDVPVVATPIDCDEEHPYQTFVAVRLPFQPRTQSELEADPRIRLLCTPAMLNRRLASGRMGAQWQIQAIPYKVYPTPDEISRCLVSTGEERTKPLRLQDP